MVSLVVTGQKIAGRLILAIVAVCCFSFPVLATSHSAPCQGARLWESGTDHRLLLAYENEDTDEGNGNPGFRRNYRQWQTLPPEEKNQFRNRMNQYKQMPPQDQQQVRQKLEQWKKLPPEDRRQIQQTLKGGKNLTPEEKEAIRRRLRNQ